MPKSVNIYEAKTKLSELVERAAAGEEFVIAKAGSPRARLIGLDPVARKSPRKLGGWEGKVWMSQDFGAPLPPDVLAYFSGESDEDDGPGGMGS
ncbi:MAG TPA: type II toxin-antitoxin system prevent-host-death family antitoxin [Gemmatimonadaceae bacterium]